jgi:hypothetical protein
MIRPEDVRDLLRKQPFVPFRMYMSNGQHYDVSHPDVAIVTRGTIVVAKAAPGGADAIGEGFHLASVLHINNIDLMPVATASKSA